MPEANVYESLERDYKVIFTNIASKVSNAIFGPLDAVSLADMQRRLDEDGYAVVTADPKSRSDVSSSVQFLMSVLRQLGTFLPQSRKGNLVHFVEPAVEAPVHSFYSNSNIGGHIHTDGTFIHLPVPDYASLICVTPADVGGDSLLTDGRKVISFIERNDPEYLSFLQKHEFYFDTDQQIASGGAIKRSILDLSQPSPRIQYFRALIELGHEKVGKTLTAEEIKALDVFDAAISHPDHTTLHKLQRGEMLIVNNNTHLHSRASFDLDSSSRDSPARLLLRVWTRRDLRHFEARIEALQ